MDRHDLSVEKKKKRYIMYKAKVKLHIKTGVSIVKKLLCFHSNYLNTHIKINMFTRY